MSSKVVAVVGATGAVGVEMLRTLEQRKFPVKRLKLLASERSAGKKLPFRGEEIPVEVLAENSFEGVELALFSAGASRSKEFAPAAIAEGCVVVDNSSAFRLDDGVPLVVPEVNAHTIPSHRGLIANPNCSTIIAVVAIYPLHQAARIKRMVVATYQAISGAGAAAMQELIDQVIALIRNHHFDTPDQWEQHIRRRRLSAKVSPQQIAFNLFPHIGSFGANGYSSEEMKLLHETRKIIGDNSIRVTCTTVRLPVMRAHSEAINLTLERKLSAAEARQILSRAPGLKVVDDPAHNRYPMPLDVSGGYETWVGRIREDISQENGLDLFVVGDQLLKGAALNAVQIAELL